MLLPLNEQKAQMTKVEKPLQISPNLDSGTVGTANVELNAIMKKCFQAREVSASEGNQRGCIHFTQPGGAERIWQSFSYWHLFDQTNSHSRTVAAGLIQTPRQIQRRRRVSSALGALSTNTAELVLPANSLSTGLHFSVGRQKIWNDVFLLYLPVKVGHFTVRTSGRF